MTNQIVHWHSKPSSIGQGRVELASSQQVPARDAFNRPLHDLRISVTDRCNFRCRYCMPKQVFGADHAFLPKHALLSFSEIETTARLLVEMGVGKLRITGGEPLLRPRLEYLIEKLARLQTPNGKPVELTLTTNGVLLAARAHSLRSAGLGRVTVSLDALSKSVFQQMTDSRFGPQEVLEGIEAAYQAGLGAVKVNMVVKASVNAGEVLAMAKYFKKTPHLLKFIEFMDVGSSNQWALNEVLFSDRILDLLTQCIGPLEALPARQPGEVAQRWRYLDGMGEVGFVSSVSRPFCNSCNRIRLSADGKLFTCLFTTQGHDLLPLLRDSGQPEESRHTQLRQALGAVWQSRHDRYSEIRAQSAQLTGPRIEMSYIGG